MVHLNIRQEGRSDVEGSFVFLIFFFNIYLLLRDRESTRRGGSERGKHRIEAGSRLRAVSTEPDVGLEPTNQEIMTRAEVRCLTD